MQCSKCRNESIIFQPYSGQHLCREHFIIDFETKAKREIRKNRWMQPGDHIGISPSGRAADEALFIFFQKIAGRRRDIQISAVRLNDTGECPGGGLEIHRCTKIARPTSLESVAVSILTTIARGRPEPCFTKLQPGIGGIPEIFPFCHIPQEEILAYARMQGKADSREVIPHEEETLYADIAEMMAGYTRCHPAAPHAVLNLCESLRDASDHKIKPQRAMRHEKDEEQSAPNS